MTTDLTLPADVAGFELSQATAVEQARAIAEVRAAVMVAQSVPRNMARVEGDVRDACGRKALADRAFYKVRNRGSGPSVHLARELARIYGNFDYGVRELRRDDVDGVSEIQAFAWDQQINVRSTRSFIVPHQRMKDGRRMPLVDLGDVYLNNQNIGARAVRECIFTVLPDWLTELAQGLCRQTIERGDGTPLPERIERMVAAFAEAFGIRQAQLEDKLGRRRGQWDAGDVAAMQITYSSIRRGEVTVEEEFPPARLTAEEVLGQDPAETGEVITDTTRRRMFALFTERGITDADEQRDGIGVIVGRVVTSRGALTELEGQKVCEHLVARVPIPPARGEEDQDGGDPS